jgi:hypothetical protein
MRRPLIAVAGVLLLTAPALAQDAGVGRYQITPSEEGFTRLDTQTGLLSHCGKRDGVWYCEPLAGADSGLIRKLDGLAGEVARLFATLNTLSARLDALTARVDTLAARQPSPGAGATGEEGAGLVEKAMRRLFDMVRQIKHAELNRV